MHTLLISLLFVVFQQGKVVVQAGTAGAEFYLDGNFVAKTDDSGTLTMESFPAGSFKFSVKKEGYRSYQGDFTIGEGESKLISVQLARGKKASPSDKDDLDSLPGGKTRRSREQTKAGLATGAPQPPLSATDSPTRATPASAPPSAGAEGGDSSAWPWLVFGSIALSAAAYWYWGRKTSAEETEPAPADEQQLEEEPVQTLKTAPEFIDELKRREELMNAGFIGGKNRRELDREEVRRTEKEIVIVLPKEAYDVKDPE